MNEKQLLETLQTLNESEIFYRNYRLAKTSAAGFDEYLLLQCNLRLIGDPDAIRLVDAEGTESTFIYGIGGERRPAISRGINIVRSSDGKARKIYVK